MASGIATRPITDFDAYEEKLGQFIYRTGLLMKPVYDRARSDLQRVVYAEGEEETVLRAVQTVIDEELAKPILIGRPEVIESRIARLGLRMRAGVDFELTNINDDPRFNDYWQQYHALTERRGVTPAAAKNLLRSRPTLISALMVEREEADAMICGLVGRFHKKLGYLRSVFDFDKGVQGTAAMTGVINDQGAWFFLDTHVQLDPSAEQIAEATLQASYRLKLFGIEPKVALLSHSNFGSHDNASAAKMRRAYQLIRARMPKLEIDGEMMADTAWDEELRTRIFPNTTLKGRANLYVMPNLDAANITYNMVRVMTDGVAIGPILMGLDQAAHILTPASTARRVVNMTAVAAVEAQIRKAQSRVRRRHARTARRMTQGADHASAGARSAHAEPDRLGQRRRPVARPAPAGRGPARSRLRRAPEPDRPRQAAQVAAAAVDARQAAVAAPARWRAALRRQHHARAHPPGRHAGGGAQLLHPEPGMVPAQRRRAARQGRCGADQDPPRTRYFRSARVAASPRSVSPAKTATILRYRARARSSTSPGAAATRARSG